MFSYDALRGHGMAWRGMAWRGMAWHGLIRHWIFPIPFPIPHNKHTYIYPSKGILVG